MRFFCLNPKHMDKRVDEQCRKFIIKERRWYTGHCAQQGGAQWPQAPVGACVEKVMYSGDRCYFLYLATWNVPCMFRNMKHLGKNITQESRYPQRGSGLRTRWPPFCAGLADRTTFFHRTTFFLYGIPEFPEFGIWNSGIPGIPGNSIFLEFP